MEYTKRAHEQRLFGAFKDSMITGILGPRRVGKSTLVEHFISTHTNDQRVVRLNMDKMSEREQIKDGKLEELVLTGIRRHLTSNNRVWVTIDEAQKCPEVFDQVKILYDRYKDQDAIKFILTGSALLELHRLSAESLAGRIKLYYLSAFNLSETAMLQDKIEVSHTIFDLIDSEDRNEKKWHDYFHHLMPYANQLKTALSALLVWGGLPEVLKLSDSTERLDYLGNYLQTYLEKDVRAIESITDLQLYRNLLDITAEQTGSVRDDTRILQALGCHRDTLKKYRGYLQSTLMFQDIHPYINKTLKRLVKSPKGYLINNGLISFLLGSVNLQSLVKTGEIGHRLENWFLNECQVWLNKNPGRHSMHYWQTSSGAEVDFVISKPPHVLPFEVTYSSSVERRKIRNLIAFREYEPKVDFSFYIYMGDFQWDRKNKIIFIPAWGIC